MSEVEEYLDVRFSKDMLAENQQKIRDLVKTASSRGDDKKLFIKPGDIQVQIKWKGSDELTWEEFKDEHPYYQNWILFNLAFTDIKNHNNSVQNSKGTLLLYVRTSNHKDESKDKFSLPDQIKYGIRCAKEYNYKVMMLYHNGVSGGYERILDDNNHVIGYDYTKGHNTSRSDFQTFIGNLNYITDERLIRTKNKKERKKLKNTIKKNKEAMEDFKKYNIKALYCLRVDRLTRTHVMMRQLFENLVVEKKIKLIFGVKPKWNHSLSLLHPYLTNKDEADIMKEAFNAEQFFIQKIRESNRKRSFIDMSIIDKQDDELNELLSNLNVTNDSSSSDDDSSYSDDDSSSSDGEYSSSGDDSPSEDSVYSSSSNSESSSSDDEEEIRLIDRTKHRKRPRRNSAPELNNGEGILSWAKNMFQFN